MYIITWNLIICFRCLEEVNLLALLLMELEFPSLSTSSCTVLESLSATVTKVGNNCLLQFGRLIAPIKCTLGIVAISLLQTYFLGAKELLNEAALVDGKSSPKMYSACSIIVTAMYVMSIILQELQPSNITKTLHFV